MVLLALAYYSLKNCCFTSALTLFCIALSVALLLGVEQVCMCLSLVSQPITERHSGLFMPIQALTRTGYLYLRAVIRAGVLIGFVPALKAYRNSLADGRRCAYKRIEAGDPCKALPPEGIAPGSKAAALGVREAQPTRLDDWLERGATTPGVPGACRGRSSGLGDHCWLV
jgi:hypothetical protein